MSSWIAQFYESHLISTSYEQKLKYSIFIFNELKTSYYVYLTTILYNLLIGYFW